MASIPGIERLQRDVARVKRKLRRSTAYGSTAADKGADSRESDKKVRREARARLGGLREGVRGARRDRVARLQAVEDRCREDKQAADARLEKASAALAAAREEQEQARGQKREAHSTCATNRKSTRAATRAELAEAKRRRDEEALEQRRDRVFDRARKKRSAGSSGATKARAKERRAESDDFVVQNLDADLLPLWRELADFFKGSPHQRYEAFLEYVEEHPGEALEARQRAAGGSRRRMDDEFAREQALYYGEAR